MGRHTQGGSISKKNGKWIWTGYYKDDAGKVHRPNKSFKTKKEADAYLKLQSENQKHVKNAKAGTDYTVREYYHIWQRETDWTEEKHYKYTTTNNWRSVFSRHILPYIGEEKLQNIDYTKLKEHFLETKLSQKTYNNILKAIKSMLAHAKDTNEDLVIVDNLHKVKVLAEYVPREKVFNVLSVSDYEDIVRYMRDNKLYYYNLIVFLRESGLRIEEALALEPQDINIEQRCVIVWKAVKRKPLDPDVITTKTTKTNLDISKYLKTQSSYRLVYLSTFAIRAILRQLKMLEEKKIKSPYVFPTSKGKLCDSRNVLRSFQNTIQLCNRERSQDNQIPIRGLHSLRKMFCKTAVKSGELSWYEISKAMGHSDIEVTQKYYHAFSMDDIKDLARKIDAADARLKDEHVFRSFEGADGDVELSDYYAKKEKDLIDGKFEF